MKVDIELFWQELEKTTSMAMATSKDDVVTIRPISPLRHVQEIVICTDPNSRKAAQISANPNVAICLGPFYLQGRARNLGAACQTANLPIKEAYCARYPGAFKAESPQFTGDEIFIAITLAKLSQCVADGENAGKLAETFF